MIKKLSRGSVTFEFEGRTATLQGEAYLRGFGSPDFVVYANSLLQWDPPHEAEMLDGATKARLFDALLVAFQARGMSAEIE
jgi:Immunity protein 74